MEGAAAGGASWETQAVRRGGVGDAVDRRHWIPLGAGRNSNAAAVEEEGDTLGSKARCTTLLDSFSTADLSLSFRFGFPNVGIGCGRVSTAKFLVNTGGRNLTGTVLTGPT